MKYLAKSSLRKIWITGSVLLVSGAILALPQEPAAAPPAETQAQDRKLSPEQLDNLVAPIALYPDPVLSQVLAASTYPLEIVEAQQWLQQNKNLHGDALMNAARQQNWDPSVEALAAFPDVLSMLNQDIRWTTDLGNTFLSQQGDVMNAVQRLRTKAKAAGKLVSSPQQTVVTKTQGNDAVIEIWPADPQVVYVPVYNPAYVWGPPVWGYYPPLFYSGFGYGFGPGVNLGFYFGGWGGWGGWGWSPAWFSRTVIVNNYFFHRYGFHPGPGGIHGPGTWIHDPSHRLGVAYPNHELVNRFQGPSAVARSSRLVAPRSFAPPATGMHSGFVGARTAPAPTLRGGTPQIHTAPRMTSPTPHLGGRGFHGGGFHGGGAFHGGRR